MVLISEFRPGFGGREPDSLVIINCECFHSGNLPGCSGIFKEISGWVWRTFWEGFSGGLGGCQSRIRLFQAQKRGG